MKDVEFTKLSTKGQIVIPETIREDMNLRPGTPFAVVEQRNGILLQKIEMPKIKSWAEATKPFREAAKKSGFIKTDLDMIIKEVIKSR